MIRLEPRHCFHGPNPYASEPVVVVAATIPGEVQARAHELARAMESLFPDWFRSTVDPGLAPDLFTGQFIARWSLAALNQIAGFLHTAGARRAGDQVEIWLGFHHAQLAHSCLDFAASLFAGTSQGMIPPAEAQSAVRDLWQLCVRFHPHPSVRILMVAARELGIPCGRYLEGKQYWQFGWGERSLVFLESRSNEDSHTGARILRDKSLAKRVFATLGVPVANQAVVKSRTELERAVSQVGWPCVAKPLDESQSRGVTTDIRTMAELKEAFRVARGTGAGAVMLEAFVPGDVYRLLLVRGRLVAAVRRECPFVTGDGERTVAALVADFNARRREGRQPGDHIGEIPTDDEFRLNLEKQELTPDSIPAAGRKVRLRRIPFQRTGGINTNVITDIHPDVKVMAETLARSFDIKIAGLDYITEDIGKSYREHGVVLEMNTNPALRALVNDQLDDATLGKMVLGDGPGRLPVHLVVVKPDDLEAFDGCWPPADDRGWVWNGRAGIGATRLALPGDSVTGSAASLLKNRLVGAVTIVLTASDLAREGMPVDRADRVLVQDDRLDPAWLSVLEHHCGELMAVPDAAAATQQLLAAGGGGAG